MPLPQHRNRGNAVAYSQVIFQNHRERPHGQEATRLLCSPAHGDGGYILPRRPAPCPWIHFASNSPIWGLATLPGIGAQNTHVAPWCSA